MAIKKTNQLSYSEFLPPDKNQWLSEVKKILKKSLSASGYAPFSNRWVDPLYTEDDENQIHYLKGLSFKEKSLDKGWELRETIYINSTEIETTLQKAAHALNQGVDGIIYDLRLIDDKKLLLSFLKNIPQQSSISFIPQKKQLPLLFKFLSFDVEKDIKGSLYADPIGDWATTGFSYGATLRYLSNALKSNVFQPDYHCMVIDGSLFQEAGGHQIHELAFTLSKIVVYLDEFTDLGHDPQDLIRQMEFSMSVGSDFITEIAKVRAFKLLVCQLAKAYGVADLFPHQILVHGQMARWNQSATDQYTNLIRNTAETIAALLGGCRFLTVNPDQESVVSENFDRRMYRNISHILEHEAHFGKVADPVAGSYFIDHLTDQLIEQAWASFLKLEDLGGFIQGIQSGYIKKEISSHKINLIQKIREGKKVLIGINKYKPEGLATAKNFIADQENNESHTMLLKPFRIAEIV